MINNESELLREKRGVGRPQGSEKKTNSGKFPYLSLRRDRERRRSDEIKVAPIALIEDDYRAVLRDPKRKMNHLTLRYLKDRKIISNDQFVTYSWAHTLPEERTIITEKNVIEHVNLKLIGLYESI